MNKNYTKMATYVFCSACKMSVTSNWITYKSELEGMYDVELTTQDLILIIAKMVENFGNAILDISLCRKKLTCYDDRYEYAIDFVLGTDYCLEIEEEKENV